MFGGDENNQVFPISLDNNLFPHHTKALPQQQLFGEFSVGCSVTPINYTGNDHASTVAQRPKRSRVADSVSRQQTYQRYPVPSSHEDQSGQSVSFQNQNLASTRLRLSYKEEEHNSSVTTVSESMKTTIPIISSLGDSIKVEIDRNKQEFDRYIKIQEENMLKGAWEFQQRHTVSFLSAIEKGVQKRLQENKVEIEKVKGKNNELVEKIKQVSTEVQSWHCKAKYNESLVTALRNNLKQVMAQGTMDVKEGCGESEVDDSASNNRMCILEHSGNLDSPKNQLVCRHCKAKEVSVFMLPCRHLCLCKDCGSSINVCPICQVTKRASVQVHMH